jgi:two-component system LytT family sensor kinase
MHSLKTRYGSELNWLINVDAAHTTYQIPPLTLQLLVENAVRHNIILPEEPLTVTIFTNSPHQLVITNNLQRKNAWIHSNGVGLNNILTKYKMLGLAVPVIQEDETQFNVLLPMIE